MTSLSVVCSALNLIPCDSVAQETAASGNRQDRIIVLIEAKAPYEILFPIH